MMFYLSKYLCDLIANIKPYIFVFFIGLLILGWAFSSKVHDTKSRVLSTQERFCKIISTYSNAYFSEKNKSHYIDQEAAVQNFYNARTDRLKHLLKNGNVQQWQGTIYRIRAGDNGAHLKVKLLCNTYLETTALISKNSVLYQKLRGYSEQSPINFSGHFIVPSNQKDVGHYPYEIYYSETSITESGSMEEPEFNFVFTAFN